MNDNDQTDMMISGTAGNDSERPPALERFDGDVNYVVYHYNRSRSFQRTIASCHSRDGLSSG
jgi:hypothetical protein